MVGKVVNLEFDSETGEYYIIWSPVFVAAGGTQVQVLEDLRDAAHFGVDTLIDLELKNIYKED